METKQKHPTHFLEPLKIDHIKSWSNEGVVVFDPFMGSSTTDKIAVRPNGECVDLDKLDKCYTIAKEHLVRTWSRQLELEDTE